MIKTLGIVWMLSAITENLSIAFPDVTFHRPPTYDGDDGVPIAVVWKRLGYSKVTTTLDFTHSSAGEGRRRSAPVRATVIAYETPLAEA